MKFLACHNRLSNHYWAGQPSVPLQSASAIPAAAGTDKATMLMCADDAGIAVLSCVLLTAGPHTDQHITAELVRSRHAHTAMAQKPTP